MLTVFSGVISVVLGVVLMAEGAHVHSTGGIVGGAIVLVLGVVLCAIGVVTGRREP